MSKTFNIGDKVFAKVKGYPPWPAEIQDVDGKKYKVKFYGSNQTGLVKPDDLFYFLKNKKRVLKPTKRKDYCDAVLEIEEAIKNNNGFDGESYDNQIDENESLETSATRSAKRRLSNSSSGSQRSQKARIEGNKSIDNQESSEEQSVVEPDEPLVKENEPCLKDNVTDSVPEESVDLTVKLISKKQLQNYIEYAKYVKRHESLFKSKSVESRNDFKNEVFPVVLPSKMVFGLRLHRTFPVPSFVNEYERAVYDENSAENALSLAEALENGSQSPDSNAHLLINLEMNESDILRQFEEERVVRKQEIINRLKLEGELIYIGQKIRSCLNLDRAEPKKAVDLLNKMLEKEFDELILKKHIHIVETIRRLRCYVGNPKRWNMSEEVQRKFEIDAKNVREVAEQIYKKIKEVMNLSDSSDFWSDFVKKYNEFYKRCNELNLSHEQKSVLCNEPNSRQAYFDYLNDEYLLLK